jgi:transposase
VGGGSHGGWSFGLLRTGRWRHLDSPTVAFWSTSSDGWIAGTAGCASRRSRARRGARHTQEFEDLVAFCAQRMAENQVQALLRIARDAVGRIIIRVVADHLDERRLDGPIQIGSVRSHTGAGCGF